MTDHFLNNYRPLWGRVLANLTRSLGPTQHLTQHELKATTQTTFILASAGPYNGSCSTIPSNITLHDANCSCMWTWTEKINIIGTKQKFLGSKCSCIVGYFIHDITTHTNEDWSKILETLWHVICLQWLLNYSLACLFSEICAPHLSSAHQVLYCYQSVITTRLRQ